MAEAAAERQSFVNRLMPLVYKIAGPLTKFGSMPFVTAITNAMAGTIGITMIGSLALVLYLLCSDGGIITAIVAGFIAIQVTSFCYDKNIKNTQPDSVPPAIGDSFSAVIPYAFAGIICWTIRTVLNFDLATWVTTILMPVLGAADNIGMYTLQQFLSALLWSAGLHGDNITTAATNTFTTAWDLQNVEALLAGTAVRDLLHVWTTNLCRLGQWTSSCWPLLILMWKDSKKLPQLRSLAIIAFPPAIFCIIEPIMFGLPIMLNPYLIIPFILSHTVSAVLAYAVTALGLVGKLCVSLPWATPAPILGFVGGGGGSIGGALWPFVTCAIGLVIFWPFWRAYVDSELKKIEAREDDAEAAA